jgi:hypothetical protein
MKLLPCEWNQIWRDERRGIPLLCCAGESPHLNETQSLKKDQSSYVSGLLRGAGQKPSGDLWPYVRDLG